MYDVIQELEKEYREKRLYWEMYIGADLRRMFITIFRECEELLASVRVDASAAIAYKVLNYLDHHYPEDISVTKLAETFFLNKHYIAHVFKAETGYSPMDYVISLRMNRAKALLAETARSISEIAVECGYTDFNHFSKLFKKYAWNVTKPVQENIRKGIDFYVTGRFHYKTLEEVKERAERTEGIFAIFFQYRYFKNSLKSGKCYIS